MGSGLARLVFQPPMPSYSADPNLIWLTTSRSEVIPAFYISRENARYTLLFSHGNAEDLGLIIRYFRDVSHMLTVNVFAYEYTGYGMSTGQGRSEESAVYSDIEAAFKYVRDVIGIPWTQIVPYGRSIGTAPSVHLAARTAVRGIVLQSPMVSIYRIPFQLRFTLPGDLFANIDKIGDVCCPVFIIHGTRDEIVPVWHSQSLHDVCAKKGTAYGAYVVQGADHNNLEVQAGDEFYDRLQRFLQHLDQSPVSEKLRRQAENSRL
uniref:Peptidase S9 prolyl oligopeptidase catalytic domain-containing protein n=1 Tax=Alexandrium catenella TaxID=2925 RepID=A0A7S1QD41_ALECA